VFVDSTVPAVLAALAPVLRSCGNRWYVFGAQAVAIWGRPRMSADLDVTAAILSSHDEFVTAMQGAGFDLRVDEWRAFLDRTRVLPFVHRATGLPLDIVIAGPGLEDEFLDRATTVEIADLSVPIISPEDLVITKVLAGRTKDLEDIRTILDQQLPDLDLSRIRTLIDLLQQALSRSDLSPAFETLLAAAQCGE
jgi:hypothetical protein